MPLKAFLEIGEVVGTHGIAGEMRVQPWCDSPTVFCNLKTLYTDENGSDKIKVKSRPHHRIVLMKTEGVTDATTAATWRGKVLYAARRDLKLPAGRYFICDLIGLEVKDCDTGEVYGKIVDVTNTGASDIYHMQTTGGKLVLIPAIPDIVLSVEPEGNGITIRVMEGLFDT